MRLYAIRVPKTMAEQIRRLLLQCGLIHPDAQIRTDGNHILIPTIEQVIISELTAQCESNVQNSDSITVIETEFELKRKKPTLEDILGFYPAFDVIGDIAIIDACDPDAKKIASALLECRKSIKVVLGTAGPVSGEFRTRNLIFLLGEHRMQTVHTEYGCRYKLDLSTAYFSQRLSTERKRVVDTVKSAQMVIDLFAGVGPFSILIARSIPTSSVIAVDKNPEAVQLIKENIQLNHLDNIMAVEDDARHAAVEFGNSADHVIMNLPHSSRKFIDSAITAAKDGGLIHFYDITPQHDLYQTSWELIKEEAARLRRRAECIKKRIVRSYAPYQYNVCIEFRVYSC
jgi:tRNA (guanine37-N1)-methyltransferase